MSKGTKLFFKLQNVGIKRKIMVYQGNLKSKLLTKRRKSCETYSKCDVLFYSLWEQLRQI